MTHYAHLSWCGVRQHAVKRPHWILPRSAWGQRSLCQLQLLVLCLLVPACFYQSASYEVVCLMPNFCCLLLVRLVCAADTLHRFCKKEHDWGWKKFMELSKVLEGFTVANTLVIKAQVQVIRYVMTLLTCPCRHHHCHCRLIVLDVMNAALVNCQQTVDRRLGNCMQWT